MERYYKKFTGIVERIMSRWGYTSIDGRIYATLLLSDKPLTISDLHKAINLSRSSISTSLARLTRDYLVDVRKKGKIKLFTAISGFLEKFLEQPKELLDKEIKPLEDLIQVIIKRSNSKEYKIKLQEIFSDLESLNCILSKIIKLEKKSKC